MQITLCDILIDVTLEAIDFYHMYYKNELLFVLSLAMLGWLLIALGKIFIFGDIFSEIPKSLLVTGFLIITVVCGYNLCKFPSIIWMEHLITQLLFCSVL